MEVNTSFMEHFLLFFSRLGSIVPKVGIDQLFIGRLSERKILRLVVLDIEVLNE